MTVLALQSIHFSDGTVLGYEILARRVVSGRFQSPAQFMVDCRPGDWAQLDKEVVRLINENLFDFSNKGPLFVNLSPETLSNYKLVKDLIHSLAKTVPFGLDVIIEVSEKFSGTPVELDRIIAEARLNGLRVAIDDYGSDNSDFRRLTQHKWDFCKIDLPAVPSINKLPWLIEVRDYCLLNHVGLILEKVEDMAILEGWLRPLSGASLQGFALSKPEFYKADVSSQIQFAG
ncbi:EAL domain-containing protein [Pseudomonas sp. LS-2]|uniref:EAL domain-containing protein n=1 Tax=Pseudomonas sp. LS-2 TaxID=2315859 RepID=UPI0014049BB1|nr:EAL domain-containing protein [Pseudomonas sp. LS-2]